MASQWILHGGASLRTNSSNVTAPNGTNTSGLLGRTTAESYARRIDEALIPANTEHVFTVFVRSTANVSLRVGNVITDSYTEAAFNLTENSVLSGPISVGDNVISTIAHIENVGGGWYSIQLGFAFRVQSQVQLAITTGDTLENTTETASLNMWSPALERRSLRDDPAYLGTGYSGSIPGVDNTFTLLPVLRGTTRSVEYQNKTGRTVTVGVENQNTNYSTANSVAYIRIPQSPQHGFPNRVVINNNRGGSSVINIDRQVRYQKRPPVRITFANKQGVLEDFWASRKVVESIEVKTDDYYRNVIDYTAFSYDPDRHTKTQYNTVGRKKWVIDTDNISEGQNDFMEELHMSEYIWLTYDGRTFPVTRSDLGFSYKTHVNDKLVQYRLTFLESNRLDNTIR